MTTTQHMVDDDHGPEQAQRDIARELHAARWRLTRRDHRDGIIARDLTRCADALERAGAMQDADRMRDEVLRLAAAVALNAEAMR